jgi:hypothetical protein
VTVILDGEPCAFADAAHTQTQHIAAVGVQRPVKILAGCYKRATQRKHRCGAACGHPERRARIRTGKLGANCGLYWMVREILWVAELVLRV